ncbi:MAG: fumarylacetoacetate hydrolase family protein [Candidatus Bathyarchaeia archaeon]
MKLTSYRFNGETRLGLVLEGRVFDLNKSYTTLFGEGRVFPSDMISLLEGGEKVLGKLRDLYVTLVDSDRSSRARGISYMISEVEVLAPIPRPRKNIICLGVNYPEHAAERNREPPKYPVFFTKPPTAVIGPNKPIVVPRCSQMVDYEVELAFIFGKNGKDIEIADAWDYIAGYTVINDVTARDLQRIHQQWFKGKSLDTFAPMGPFLVTSDDVKNPHNLQIRLLLNGEIMQDDNTSNLFFKIPEIVAYLSAGMTVEAGDIVATGTPGGVGDSRTPRRYLKAGDVVQAEVEDIGVLENPVVKA